ncbi:phage portal protein [Desulfoluna spongiiphila]|uniref:Phage portal protein, lambda family n=1 Tax=Desulfoluna spongiiphila TaxID=419481 RepID=A0A1G5G229_9BACT|nr:phage portal protein [Desulfoluna spongiiphila]SCY44838.1 phage portal protein, lambda family [Desulfoluna spongiiphila]
MILDRTGIPYARSGAFEGASQSPRMSSFMAPTIGPNTAVGNSLASLRGRSRQAIRNNPLAKGGQGTFTSNMVGSGITPRFQFKDPDLKEQVQELWLDSVPEFDFDGNADFYGLQAVASNALFSDGEVLALFRPRNSYADLAVPFQVQLLEADHLDVAYSTTLPNGNKIRMGIEFSRTGQRVAYHLHKDHPGEYFMNDNSAVRTRIPAKNICHIFDPMRPGQQRGLPGMASILAKLHEIDQCVDAELVRRKTTAMFGGFITQINEYNADDPNPLGFSQGAGNGVDVVALEPGTFPVLLPGQTVTLSQPRDVSGNYVAWMKQQLMDVATGMGITYDQLTGDLADVNYSSIRAGLLEFRRRIIQLQNKTLIFQFCRPVIQRWLTTAIVAGALSIPDYLQNKRRYWRGIHWQPQPWKWIDPDKDMKGEIREMRAGLKTYGMALADRGLDVESIFNEWAEELSIIDKLRLIFDTDPRNTAGTGVLQPEQGEGDEN